MVIREQQLQAPSIGTVRLDFDPKGNRVRQILESKVLSEADIVPTLDTARVFAEAHGATRQSVRALVTNELIHHLGDQIQGYEREAQIALSSQHAGFSLVYFGANAPERYSVPEVLEGEAHIIEALHVKEPKDPRAVIEKAQVAGFNLERLTYPLSESDMSRLVEMYQQSFTSYPFNIEEEILDMVQRESSCVYAARRKADGLLYAVCATEEVALSLSDGTTFSMREMGDSARIQVPEGQGLNAPLKLMLLLEAFRDGTDLVFCETRAALVAVNANNYNIGMYHSGLLPKSTVISGPQDVLETELDGETNSRYGNMNVWAVNREQITTIARQLGERR